MKKFFVFFLIVINCSGQGVNSNWLVGYEDFAGLPTGVTKMEFVNNNLNTIYYPIPMWFGISLGIISNENGEILFYTNGYYIANGLNDTMSNGTGLNPSLYTSSVGTYGLDITNQSLILRFPNDSNKYYIFHCTIDDDPIDILTKNIYYSVIDMSLDSGKGEVIQKNQILLTNKFTVGKITACKHANGRDWWVFAHGFRNKKVYRWFVSPSGISGPTIFNWMIDRDNWAGTFIFSPDGSKAVYHGNAQGTEIYDFDRCSGTFSNGIYFPSFDSSGAGGATISSNSKYLYINCVDSLWQYDLTAANIPASEIFIDKYNGDVDSISNLPTNFVSQVLAADGKIYMATGNSTRYYHVINNPDSAGTACNFVQQGLQIPTIKYITVPNFPNYYLGADTNSACDTLSGIGFEEYNKEKINIKIFPNPTNSNSTVTLQYKTITEKGTLQLYNTDGKMVKEFYVSPYTSMFYLKLPALSSGIYLFKLTSGDKRGSVKIIVE